MSYAGIERRRWPRIPAAALGNVSVAMMQGPDKVQVIDLSRGGALLEVAARFPLKTSVRLRVTQPNGETIVVDGRVARAKVAALVNGVINYRFAVIFDQPIVAPVTDDQLTPPAAETGAPAVAGADVPAAAAATVAAPQPAQSAGERTLVIVPPRTVPAVSPSESDDPPLALRSELEKERSRLEKELGAATAELARQSTVNQSLAARLEESDELRIALRSELERERSRLEKELAAATADLARESSVTQSLTARLEESDHLRTSSRDALEAERRQREEERSTFQQQLADAVTVADGLHATLEAREQEQAQALAEQRQRYDALIAELVNSTNDQQTEYQQLVEELTAAGDEQRRRADQLEAEIARQRGVAQQDQAATEARFRELEARLEAAEALCAAHDERNQALRRQLGKLVSMFTEPVSPAASQPDEPAFARETEAEQTRAIA